MRRLVLGVLIALDIVAAVALSSPFPAFRMRIALALLVVIPLVLGTLVAAVLSVGDWLSQRKDRSVSAEQ